MKIDKQDLYNSIEEIIGNGVENMEEVDVTTKKVVVPIWKIITYLKDELTAEKYMSEIQRNTIKKFNESESEKHTRLTKRVIEQYKKSDFIDPCPHKYEDIKFGISRCVICGEHESI